MSGKKVYLSRDEKIALGLDPETPIYKIVKTPKFITEVKTTETIWEKGEND